MVLDQATHDHGRWCAEVLEALELLHAGKPPPLHVGMSVGGAMLMDLALVRPEAIGAAALVVPGCLHPGGKPGHNYFWSCCLKRCGGH